MVGRAGVGAPGVGRGESWLASTRCPRRPTGGCRPRRIRRWSSDPARVDRGPPGGRATGTHRGGPAALEGLHTNVVVVVHAVAVASLSALQDRNHLGEQRSLLRAVQARTERWPSVPAPERRGRYEDVAAVAAGNSLDSAISNWARATVDILTSRR